MSPTVDVVIPMLDAEPFITSAVASALAQQEVLTRVIVVDAGSTDRGPELVASWQNHRITFLTGYGRLKSGAARNVGMRAVTADWVAFLDADDLWPHDRTIRLLSAIQAPDRQLALGHQVTFPDGAAVDPAIPITPQGHPPAALAGGILLSRELAFRVGDFDPAMPIGEFIDWMARARILGIEEVQVPIVSLLRRNHATNTSRQRRDDYSAGYLDIVRRQVTRRRAAEATDAG